jgi:hypothetical protein
MVHRRHLRTPFEEHERVHRLMLPGCACSAQGTETSVRGIETRLSTALHQGQGIEHGQHSKQDREYRTCSRL